MQANPGLRAAYPGLSAGRPVGAEELAVIPAWNHGDDGLRLAASGDFREAGGVKESESAAEIPVRLSLSSSLPEALLYESHCHTRLCKHAYGEPEDYVAVARGRNLRGITFTCHCPLPDGNSAHVRMEPGQYADYLAMIAAARAEDVDVRTGIESDYYPGVEPWLEELHARVPLSHVLGSVHYQLREYRARYYAGDVVAYQKQYYEHLAMSAETGLFDTLAHPDLVKNESPADWDFARLREDVCRALDRIAATGVAMELNTSGVFKSLPEMNPSLGQLQLMRERGIPVVLGADAHVAERVGDGFVEGLGILLEAGYERVSYFVDRKRRDVSVEEALGSLGVLSAR